MSATFTGMEKTRLTTRCRKALMWDVNKDGMDWNERSRYELLDSATRLRLYAVMDTALALWLAIPDARRKAMKEDADRNSMMNINAQHRGEPRHANTKEGRCENPPADACCVLYFTNREGVTFHRPFQYRRAAEVMIGFTEAMGMYPVWIEEIDRSAPIAAGTAELTETEKRKLRARARRAQTEESREGDIAAD